MTQTTEQKNYVLPKFYTCKGNLAARWYIEFQATNVDTGLLEKRRIVCPAKFETKKQRELWAKEHIKAITGHLVKGRAFGAETTEETKPTQATSLITELEQTIEVLKKSLRGKSVITYTSALNKLTPFIKRKGEAVTASQFSATDVLLFRDYLQTELSNSPRTANNTVEHLNTLYGHMKLRNLLAPESPFKIKKLREEVTQKNIALTDQDRKTLEEYLQEKEPQLYAFTRCIYYAFIRPGELHALTLADFRIEDKYIIIPGHVSKNRKTETVQIVPPLFRELIKLEIADAKQHYFLFGKGIEISRHVSAKQVAFRRHEKALKACGLEGKGYTLYSWKHTGAVNAYRTGVGVKELQRLLRHSSVNITDIYLKSLGLRTDPNIQNYEW